MGDIAEGMINGDFDCMTGEYLGPGGGYPRTRSGKDKGDSQDSKIKRVQARYNINYNAAREVLKLIQKNSRKGTEVVELKKKVAKLEEQVSNLRAENAQYREEKDW